MSLDSVVYIVAFFCVAVITIVAMVMMHLQGRSMPSRFRFDKRLVVPGTLFVGGYAILAMAVGSASSTSLALRAMLGVIGMLAMVGSLWEHYRQARYIKLHPQYTIK